MTEARDGAARRTPRCHLILRKAGGLSRWMGRAWLHLPPILRDGPGGPPQDEGVAADRLRRRAGCGEMFEQGAASPCRHPGLDPGSMPLRFRLAGRALLRRQGLDCRVEPCNDGERVSVSLKTQTTLVMPWLDHGIHADWFPSGRSCVAEASGLGLGVQVQLPPREGWQFCNAQAVCCI